MPFKDIEKRREHARQMYRKHGHKWKVSRKKAVLKYKKNHRLQENKRAREWKQSEAGKAWASKNRRELS